MPRFHVIAGVLLALVLSAPVGAATFVVNSSNDASDGNCNSAHCSLREALTAANATSVQDTINFSISTPASGEILISPTSDLPTIIQPLIINGYSQAGSAVNTDPVASNALLRIRLDGLAMTSGNRLLEICANSTIIRGLSLTRTTIGSGVAIRVCETVTTSVIIAGNAIGTTSSGASGAGNDNGVLASGPIRLGGTSAADRNVISLNVRGVILQTHAGSLVQGNLIGTDPTGLLDRGNTQTGVLFNASSTDHDIGSASAPNLIRFNGVGIRTLPETSISGNTWTHNRIFDNDELGIDLGNDGLTANDGNDGDSGANFLQNFPVISEATRIAGGVHLEGTLDVPAIAPASFVLGIYASSRCDASGHGEGEWLLGSRSQSFSGGLESFSFDVLSGVAIPLGSFITLTATTPGGSSSEFSACFAIDPPPFVVTSSADTDGGVCAASCTLRQAINASNANTDVSRIHFNIATPASGEILIRPVLPLPALSQPVVIDGYTQPGTSVNTDPDFTNAVLRIRLDGANQTAGSSLLSFCANQSALRGLAITGNTIGSGFGVSVCGTTFASATQLSGNFVGVATNGLTDAGSTTGIFLDGPVRIGGEDVAERNLISGNARGIVLQSNAGSIVLGNLIGGNRSGAATITQQTGILLATSATELQVGSSTAPNRFVANTDGIATNNSTSITEGHWSHNHFALSNGQSIDLANDGLTTNDLEDADTGPNSLQNFPALTLAQRSASGIRIQGTLDVPVGSSNVPYTIGVYASAACESNGAGPGERLLGTSVVSLSQSSAESFSFELITDDPLEADVQITSTASGPAGSSELSACLAASDPPPGLAVTSTADTDGSSCGETCTLRQAINTANATPGADLIRFDLPGAGPFLIQPASLLPAITEALTIDGYTQIGAAPNAAAIGNDAVLQIQIRDGAGVANGLMTCASDVTLRGLSITGFDVAAIATQMNASASCAVVGNNVRIVGNFIGVQPTGAAFSNQSGILVNNTVATIGGPALADHNVISNSVLGGVRVAGAASSGSVISGNLIGTGIDGLSDLGNLGSGVEINGASDVTVGGDGAAANEISFNAHGIVVVGAGSGNDLARNTFVGNDALAIDLSPGASADGVTANDINDVDSGANHLQNFPLLTDGSATASSITVNGTLDVPAATSDQPFVVTLYESPLCDTSSHGEGAVLLAQRTITVSGGAENFSITLNLPPDPQTHFITSTATDPSGNTSEFSACLAGPQLVEVFADGFE